MNKILISCCVIVLLAGGLSFWGGMAYQKNQSGAMFRQGGFQGFDNLSNEDRQARIEQMGIANIGSMSPRLAGTGGGFVSGEIITADNQSITIKMPDGGSRMVFFSTSTEISKFSQGGLMDLIIGQGVMVTGKSNDDGSITAESIQLRQAVSGQ